MDKEQGDPSGKFPKSGTTAYAVGYAKPPVRTRFKKGQSGNPRGRRKRSKNKPPALSEERLKAIILAEAYRTITVRDGERNISVPMAQAIVRSLAVNAAKGGQRAQKLFTELLAETERDFKRSYDEYVQTMIEYKTSWDLELARRKARGITDLPEPIPHPDQIIIDVRNGGAQIKGPMTREEQVKWDKLRARKADYETEIRDLEQDLRDIDDDQHRAFILREIQDDRKIVDLITRAIGD